MPDKIETIDIEMIAVQKREVKVVVRLPKRECRVFLEKDGVTVVPMPFVTVCGLKAAKSGGWTVVENGTREAKVSEGAEPDLDLSARKRCTECQGFGCCRKFCDACHGLGLV